MACVWNTTRTTNESRPAGFQRWAPAFSEFRGSTDRMALGGTGLPNAYSSYECEVEVMAGRANLACKGAPGFNVLRICGPGNRVQCACKHGLAQDPLHWSPARKDDLRVLEHIRPLGESEGGVEIDPVEPDALRLGARLNTDRSSILTQACRNFG